MARPIGLWEDTGAPPDQETIGPSPATHRWGPNFLFDVVIPAPATAPLFGGAALRGRRRRRRRS